MLGRITQAPEVGMNFCCRLIARCAVLFERLVNDASKCASKLGIQPGRWNRHVSEDGALKLQSCVTFKRALTRGHFIEHQPKGEQIGACVQAFSADLFWRHVTSGAKRSARLRKR